MTRRKTIHSKKESNKTSSFDNNIDIKIMQLNSASGKHTLNSDDKQYNRFFKFVLFLFFFEFS